LWSKTALDDATAHAAVGDIPINAANFPDTNFREYVAKEEDCAKPRRIIRLYDKSVAAGVGSFLNSDAYEDLEVDDTVTLEADFAVKISGDSMTPRFVDRQIVFIKQQQTLEVGEIGIFELEGDAYIKKLGRGELLSLNPLYQPIKIHEYNSFHVFGKVVG
jgi:phage repressor protein C with HTH and peptisase S24 domain